MLKSLSLIHKLIEFFIIDWKMAVFSASGPAMRLKNALKSEKTTSRLNWCFLKVVVLSILLNLSDFQNLTGLKESKFLTTSINILKANNLTYD